MQVLCSDGARVAVRVDGAGDRVVVMLHGFPLTSAIWNAQLAELAATHRVVAIDLRGMGDSSVTDGPYLMESLAGDVAAVLDALGVERAALVGHSLGGYVALAFARMYVERLERLILVCSRLGADRADQAAARLQLADEVERDGTVRRAVAAYVPRLLSAASRRDRPELLGAVEAIAGRNDARGLAAMLRGMAMRDDASDIAPDILLPVLSVCGVDDEVLDRDTARADAAAFANARLTLMERSGHLPMLEEPGAFGAVVARFLAS